MATHSAIVTVGVKAPLEILHVPTVSPRGNQVRVRVEWTASTPLDLHQNDGGLLVSAIFPILHFIHVEVTSLTTDIPGQAPPTFG